MKKNLMKWSVLALCAFVYTSCGDDDKDKAECTKATEAKDCKEGYICSDAGKCIAKKVECTQENAAEKCGADKICSADGKCVDKPECTQENAAEKCGADKICSEAGKCVDKPECTQENAAEKCGADKICSEAGKCVDKPECTQENAAEKCAEGQICSEAGKCIDDGGEEACSKNEECEKGSICTEGACVVTDNVCGNGIREGAEECDRNDFSDLAKVCGAGQVEKTDAVWSCTSECKVDKSQACIADPSKPGIGIISEIGYQFDGDEIEAFYAEIANIGQGNLDLSKCEVRSVWSDSPNDPFANKAQLEGILEPGKVRVVCALENADVVTLVDCIEIVDSDKTFLPNEGPDGEKNNLFVFACEEEDKDGEKVSVAVDYVYYADYQFGSAWTSDHWGRTCDSLEPNAGVMKTQTLDMFAELEEANLGTFACVDVVE